MMIMEGVIGLVLVTLSIASASALPSTSPAFLWSPHYQGDELNVQEVDYRTLSQKDLAKSIMSQGGWSNLLCSEKDAQKPLDLALVFVGAELQSSDISKPKNADPALLDMLKASFAKSNFSLAFPFVASSEDEAIESLLISEFAGSCGHDLDMSNIAFSESCSLKNDRFQKIPDIHGVHDYLVSRMEKGSKGQTNVVVFCHGDSSDLKHDQKSSESQIFSELLSSVEQLDAKYSVLYVSDPFKSIQYPSHRELERFLAEGAYESDNSVFCDGVCKIKSSLLEGLFVGLVFLFILISGLCCMMGIDTPTRFEAPQDS